jgi:uncharacterized protein (TIGR03437 family)
MWLRLSSCFAFCLVLAAQNVTVTVSPDKDTAAGLNGRLNMFTSTSFQPADWDYPFFTNHPDAPSLLWRRVPQHVNIQALFGALAQTSPHSWDFTQNDAIVQPLLALSDHSPLYQIATAPDYLKGSDGFLHPSAFPAFAQYSADLVQYFNTGGFNDSGRHYQSASPWPILWWGVYNEPNGNGISAADYVTLYNTVVPKMQAVDRRLKFVAVELSDYGDQPQQYLPPFIQGVTARVDAVATHFYSTCNQLGTDQDLLNAIPGFADHVQYFRAQMATNPLLAGKPVWVTENNVNADFSDGNGMSVCNPGQKFVTDARGTSAFFAAWRPLVFLSLAKAGAQSIHHWDYDADAQYGEVDYDSGAPYLSYWVNYWLNHLFPSPPGADFLKLSAGDPSQGVDAMAVRNDDGSVVVMVVNHAVRNPGSDNNGPGLSRNIVVDVSQLGAFASADLLTIDASTSGAPSPVATPLAKSIAVKLQGYGVGFLRLNTATTQITRIQNAASFQGPPVAPGEILAVFGTGLGPAKGVGVQTSTPGFLDNFVAGTRVYFDEFAAPVLYASAGQVNVVTPWEVQGRSSVNVTAEYLGEMSAAFPVKVQARTPALFTLSASGAGPAAVLNADDLSVNGASNPVLRGHYIALFATIGGAAGDGVDGRIETAVSKPNLPLTVTIGGAEKIKPSYAGAAPGFVSGAVQINVKVPDDVSPGPDVPISLTIDGVTSPSGVTLAVK